MLITKVSNRLVCTVSCPTGETDIMKEMKVNCRCHVLGGGGGLGNVEG